MIFVDNRILSKLYWCWALLPWSIDTMRKVIVAALTLTPMLLHAQANSPAQPQASAPAALHAKLIKPNEFPAETAAASTTTSPIRISTGVVAPKLIRTVGVEAAPGYYSPEGFIYDKKVVVAMTVDTTGKPSDLKIVKSVSPAMDKNVLEAVSQYRFKPATLDGAPTPIQLNLEVTLHNPAH
jgi:TonB family protein